MKKTVEITYRVEIEVEDAFLTKENLSEADDPSECDAFRKIKGRKERHVAWLAFERYSFKDTFVDGYGETKDAVKILDDSVVKAKIIKQQKK